MSIFIWIVRPENLRIQNFSKLFVIFFDAPLPDPFDLDPDQFVFKIPPGEYTEAQLRTILKTNEAVITQQSWAYSSSDPDYGERVYIWNTVGFEIDDQAKFIVTDSGERYIENFAIIPYTNDGFESFDFKSNDLIATIGNIFSLENNIDPSRIGREVQISFSGERKFTTYTLDNFKNDVISAVNPSLLPLVTLPGAISKVVEELWKGNGSINFLDEQGRPIIYGSNEADKLS